jgi:hypothetical protein
VAARQVADVSRLDLHGADCALDPEPLLLLFLGDPLLEVAVIEIVIIADEFSCVELDLSHQPAAVLQFLGEHFELEHSHQLQHVLRGDQSFLDMGEQLFEDWPQSFEQVMREGVGEVAEHEG